MTVIESLEILELMLTYIVLLLRTGPEKPQSMPLMNMDHNRTSSVDDGEVGREDEDGDDIPLAPIHTNPNIGDHGA